MNILMVVHQFLPDHVAGTEIYTYHLAHALQRRGHRVHLFFTEMRSDRPHYEVRRGEYDGLSFTATVHNHYFPTFELTYRDPQMEAVFARVLDDVGPEIVHVQHLQKHSIGYIDLAKQRGLPLLYTLHEYLLMCLRNGLLLRPGSVLCEGPEPQACAACATTDAHGPKGLGFALRVQQLVGGEFLDRTRRAWRALPLFKHLGRSSNGYVPAVITRRAAIQAGLDRVDLFLAPSQFLRQRFIATGMIRPERILYSPYGLPAEAFARVPRRPSNTLRLGFIGSIVEHKGVHVLVEALHGLDGERVECRIYGDPRTDLEYTQRLAALGTSPSVRYMGRLDPAAVPGALAEIDLLVVPSVWFENAPLTIQEAFLAGVPVLTADQGGMAELVRNGENGLHFRIGDAADLRAQLERCLREPNVLGALNARASAVRGVEEDAALMEERYRLLLQGRVPAR